VAANVVRSMAIEPVCELVGRWSGRGATWAWTRQDLDMATAARARAELTGLLSGGVGPDRVLVHLGAERFVDLHGLRVLVDVAVLVRIHGGTLVVVAPPRCLTTMLTVTGLDAPFSLAATVRHATSTHTRRPVVSDGHRDRSAAR